MVSLACRDGDAAAALLDAGGATTAPKLVAALPAGLDVPRLAPRLAAAARDAAAREGLAAGAAALAARGGSAASAALYAAVRRAVVGARVEGEGGVTIDVGGREAAEAAPTPRRRRRPTASDPGLQPLVGPRWEEERRAVS